MALTKELYKHLRYPNIALTIASTDRAHEKKADLHALNPAVPEPKDYANFIKILKNHCAPCVPEPDPLTGSALSAMQSNEFVLDIDRGGYYAQLNDYLLDLFAHVMKNNSYMQTSEVPELRAPAKMAPPATGRYFVKGSVLYPPTKVDFSFMHEDTLLSFYVNEASSIVKVSSWGFDQYHQFGPSDKHEYKASMESTFFDMVEELESVMDDAWKEHASVEAFKALKAVIEAEPKYQLPTTLHGLVKYLRGELYAHASFTSGKDYWGFMGEQSKEQAKGALYPVYFACRVLDDNSFKLTVLINH